MPNLRGHHLICLHFFCGEGYNPEFVRNLEDILSQAQRGNVRVSAGADDICRKCPHLRNAECRYSEESEEEITEMDKRAIDLLGLFESAEVGWHDIKKRIPDIFLTWHQSYCKVCGWKRACENNETYRRLLHF